ncbi:Glycine cleavage system H protein [compost metagenome]
MESVKTVSDIFCPVSGKVTAVNSTLEGSPELVNNASFGEGWMVEVEISGPEALEGLLSAAEYSSYIGND